MSTVWALRWRSSGSVPCSTSRPLRRMPTRSHSASTSLRMCEERKTVCPRALASWTVSRKATSMSGSRPLVGSSRISRSARLAKAATSCTFWRLPFDRARTFLSVSSAKRSMSDVAVVVVARAAHARQQGERLGARQRRPQVGLAGHVGDAPVRARPRRVQASRPNSSARPSVGRCSPSSSRIVVVLPAPLGPRYP